MSTESGMDGMLDMYLFENGQLLERLEEIVLEEKDADSFDEASINEIFRIMHTIKGSSGVMMFNDLMKLSHKLEDVFYFLRENKDAVVPHQELVSHVLDVSDFMNGEMDVIRDGGKPEKSSVSLIEEIDEFLKKIKNENDPQAKADDAQKEAPKENQADKEETAALSENSPIQSVQDDSNYYKILILYHEDTPMSNLKAFMAVNSFAGAVTDSHYIPEDIIESEESANTIIKDGFKLGIHTNKEQNEIEDILAQLSEIEKYYLQKCTYEQFIDSSVWPDKETGKLPTKPVSEEKADTQPKEVQAKTENPPEKKAENKTKAEEPKKKAAPQVQSFISVNVNKMDLLIDLIGELVISEAVVLQNPDLQVPGLDLTNFNKAAGQLAKITSELQDTIMSMRMMPLTNTFKKMNRIVFDISRKQSKDIDLEIIGENTEVDKNIIEHISDPLMHIIRNAVDHGIESKEERIAAGKPQKGKVTLEAKNEGGKVWIIVSDDGRGMSRKKIAAKAVKNGLIDEKTVATYTDKEVYSFIMVPGFSTNEVITEYSGRGVGMDVVVRNLQEIGGSLDVDSKEGKGSTMTLKIPLTLAIIDGILFSVGKSKYVVSTESVKEFISVTKDQLIITPDDEEYIMIRGECYPVIRLSELYNISTDVKNIEDGIMMILEYEGTNVCVFVDKLIGEQEIVVKPIPSYIKKIKGISGCTQLGDGSISLILDVGELV